jgi:hypothetical protein
MMTRIHGSLSLLPVLSISISISISMGVLVAGCHGQKAFLFDPDRSCLFRGETIALHAGSRPSDRKPMCVGYSEWDPNVVWITTERLPKAMMTEPNHWRILWERTTLCEEATLAFRERRFCPD